MYRVYVSHTGGPLFSSEELREGKKTGFVDLGREMCWVCKCLFCTFSVISRWPGAVETGKKGGNQEEAVYVSEGGTDDVFEVQVERKGGGVKLDGKMWEGELMYRAICLDNEEGKQAKKGGMGGPPPGS